MSSANVNDGVEAIQELKAAVLALEWEITDQSLDSLLGAINPLQEKWAGQKPLQVCLQIMGTLGQYVKAAKEKAHPDTIKMLHSVFDTLQLVVTDDAIDENEKVEKVRAEVAKYNELKKNISSKKETAEADKEPVEEPVQETATEEGKPAPAPAGGMPSMQRAVSADEKEVSLDRVEGESFPEADQLIDDFFTEGETIDLGFDEEEKEAVSETVPEESDQEEEIVEFNLTRVDEDEAEDEADADEAFRSKIEAELSDRLDFDEKEEVETEPVTVELETEEAPAAAIPSNLDAIIDSFAGELAAALTEEIKKRVLEEVNQLRSQMAEVDDDADAAAQ